MPNNMIDVIFKAQSVMTSHECVKVLELINKLIQLCYSC